MAGSAIVGTLKVLLTAETGQYTTGLDAASKKTSQFSGEMSGFATQVSGVGKALSGLLTVGAITAAANQVINYASRISDLSAQTGLTTKTIQEMQHAANLTGATLDNFTNAAFKLGVNLAGGSGSVVGALQRLGLSYDELRRMSPDQQFNVITTALGHVKDAQERNRLAVELFGKVAKEILPAISQGYDDLAKSASVAGDQQIKALDMAGDALDSFLTGAKNLSVQLAGGLVIAIRELNNEIIQNLSMVKEVKRGFETWGNTLEVIGAKSGSPLPKLNEALTHTGHLLKGLPQPIGAVNLSTEEQERRMKALEQQHVKVAVSTRSVGVAQEEVDENIQRLTSSFERQIESFRQQNTLANSVLPTFRLMRVEFTETIPVIQNLITNGFEPFKATIEENKTSISNWSGMWGQTMSQLPGVIMGAIQGGGSAISAAGSLIGTNMMAGFVKNYGELIKSALPFGLGNAVTALLPVLGAMFGPVAEKIAGFFRRIFGGPSEEEIRGREAVAEFEDQLHGLLTQTQLNEAGNESWKMTVIAIRDAYLAAGKTEAEAMMAAERLWQSSKKGAGETEAAIAAIQAVLDKAKVSTEAVDAAMDEAFTDRSFTVTENRVVNESLNRTDPGENGPMDGFAGGTLGRLGKWFGNFPSTGFATALHGVEAVITPSQAPQFAMDVLGGSIPSGGGGDMSGVIMRLESLERLWRDFPRAVAVAQDDANMKRRK